MKGTTGQPEKNGHLQVLCTVQAHVIGSKLHQSVSPTAKSTSLFGDNLGLFDEDLTSRPRWDCARSRLSAAT